MLHTPNQDRINKLTTQLTKEISEMFLEITNKRERQTKIINYLGKELALALAKLEVYGE